MRPSFVCALVARSTPLGPRTGRAPLAPDAYRVRPQLGTTCRRCDLPLRIACRPHEPRALRTQHGPSALRTPHEPRALSVVRLFEDDHVGDALSGASCGFSTLNPYGGWESLFNRMAESRKGAACNALAARRHNINQTACTDASRCVRGVL